MMTRIRLVCFVALSLFAFSIAVTTAALAGVPEITEPKPTEKAPIAFTSTGGASEFETVGKKKIKCEKLVNVGKFTGPQLGVITINFEGCKFEGANCKTANTAIAGEIILEKADIHLVDFKKEAKLTLGLVVNFSETAITCGAATLPLRAKNGVIATVDEVTTGVATKNAKLLFHQSGGKQEFKACELEAAFCEKKEFFLEGNFGAGFETTGLFTEDNITFAVNVTITF
jgi:hypothetical protein